MINKTLDIQDDVNVSLRINKESAEYEKIINKLKNENSKL